MKLCLLAISSAIALRIMFSEAMVLIVLYELLTSLAKALMVKISPPCDA
ncbi:MAG: hypothetical protein NZ893_02775 [Candidatus Aenigmarchaeota archaeon]|nr:hypothetical protein [Candidatus Aenigmarchaeota archaeon]